MKRMACAIAIAAISLAPLAGHAAAVETDCIGQIGMDGTGSCDSTFTSTEPVYIATFGTSASVDTLGAGIANVTWTSGDETAASLLCVAATGSDMGGLPSTCLPLAIAETYTPGEQQLHADFTGLPPGSTFMIHFQLNGEDESEILLPLP